MSLDLTNKTKSVGQGLQRTSAFPVDVWQLWDKVSAIVSSNVSSGVSSDVSSDVPITALVFTNPVDNSISYFTSPTELATAVAQNAIAYTGFTFSVVDENNVPHLYIVSGDNSEPSTRYPIEMADKDYVGTELSGLQQDRIISPVSPSGTYILSATTTGLYAILSGQNEEGATVTGLVAFPPMSAGVSSRLATLNDQFRFADVAPIPENDEYDVEILRDKINEIILSISNPMPFDLSSLTTLDARIRALEDNQIHIEFGENDVKISSI